MNVRMNIGIGRGRLAGLLALAVAAWTFPAHAGTETVGMVTWSFDSGPDGAVVTGAAPAEGYLDVPPSLGGQPVAEIASGAFSGCDRLEAVRVPEGVQRIGSGAFSNCWMLNEIDLPNSLQSVAGEVVVECPNLRSVTIPQCLCNGSFRDAFPAYGYSGYGSGSITNVTICEGVTDIENYAFSGCFPSYSSGPLTVTLPSTLRTIGTGAFSECGGLMSLVMQEGVTDIGNDAFRGCFASSSGSSYYPPYGSYPSSDSALVLPSTLTNIGAGAFSYCGLSSVTIPSGVTDIRDSTFAACSNLYSLSIPGSVTNIGPSAFSGCSGLADLTLSSGIKTIGDSAFSECSNLTACIIPDGVSSIGGNAFTGAACCGRSPSRTACSL